MLVAQYFWENFDFIENLTNFLSNIKKQHIKSIISINNQNLKNHGAYFQ
jgi:hypothetical protein